MPTLTGMSAADAEAALTAAAPFEIEVVVLVKENDGTHVKGEVFSQVPEGGGLLEEGDAVTLLVAGPP